MLNFFQGPIHQVPKFLTTKKVSTLGVSVQPCVKPHKLKQCATTLYNTVSNCSTNYNTTQLEGLMDIIFVDYLLTA